MARFFGVVLVLFCLSYPASSQVIRQWGVKLGGGLSVMNWELYGKDQADHVHSRLGINAGAYAEWLNLPLFSVVSEAHYIQKGARYDIPVTTVQFPDGNGTSYRFHMGLNYLSFAILPKLRLEAAGMEIYALGGPRLDVELSHSVSVDKPDQGWPNVERFFDPVLDDFNKTQFGLTVGAGIQLNSLLPVATGLEVRYSPNMQDAYTKAPWKISGQSFEFMLTLSK